MLFTSWQWSGGFGSKNILMIITILDSICRPVTDSAGVLINVFLVNY